MAGCRPCRTTSGTAAAAAGHDGEARPRVATHCGATNSLAQHSLSTCPAQRSSNRAIAKVTQALYARHAVIVIKSLSSQSAAPQPEPCAPAKRFRLSKRGGKRIERASKAAVWRQSLACRARGRAAHEAATHGGIHAEREAGRHTGRQPGGVALTQNAGQGGLTAARAGPNDAIASGRQASMDAAHVLCDRASWTVCDVRRA
jgi:hypothetical protein